MKAEDVATALQRLPRPRGTGQGTGRRDMSEGWRYYLPGDGETAADATLLWKPGEADKSYSPKDAAEEACARDCTVHGCRNGTEFTIVVIAPSGTEWRFVGWHEPSVEHYVRAKP